MTAGPSGDAKGRKARIALRISKCFIFSLLLLILVLFSAGAVIRQASFRSTPYRPVLRSDPEILRSHVDFLCNQCPGRNCANPASLLKAANYIEKTFSMYSGKVENQTLKPSDHYLRNVIAKFGPDRGRVLVLGAHYDVYGDIKGADDNASGVAGLLELSRLFSNRPPSVPVHLVAYPNLEPPYFAGPDMGSSIHAKSLADSGIPTRGMISLNMIGCFSGRQKWPYFFVRLFYPVDGDFIAIGGRWQDRMLSGDLKAGIKGAGGVKVVSYSGPVIIGTDLSDHRSYWVYGCPGVVLTDTAFMRNTDYHTTRDTPEKLDYVRMARVVDGVFNTAISYDN